MQFVRKVFYLIRQCELSIVHSYLGIEKRVSICLIFICVNSTKYKFLWSMRYSIKTHFVSMKYIQGEHYYWHIFQLSHFWNVESTPMYYQCFHDTARNLDSNDSYSILSLHCISYAKANEKWPQHTQTHTQVALTKSVRVCITFFIVLSLSQYFMRNNTMSRSSPSSRSIMNILEVLRSTFVVSSSVLEVVSVVIGESLGRIPW